MADSKISELTSATSIGVSDLLYVVQSNTSKKLTTAVLFANAANVTLKGNINLDSSVQTLSTAGAITLTSPITHLSADASGGAITIPAGTTNQLKYVVMTSTAGGSYTINGVGSNIAANANVVFSAVGKTAQLLYTDSKWFMVGGSATLT